jgi:hypothetical protein
LQTSLDDFVYGRDLFGTGVDDEEQRVQQQQQQQVTTALPPTPLPPPPMTTKRIGKDCEEDEGLAWLILANLTESLDNLTRNVGRTKVEETENSGDHLLDNITRVFAGYADQQAKILERAKAEILTNVSQVHLGRDEEMDELVNRFKRLLNSSSSSASEFAAYAHQQAKTLERIRVEILTNVSRTRDEEADEFFNRFKQLLNSSSSPSASGFVAYANQQAKTLERIRVEILDNVSRGREMDEFIARLKIVLDSSSRCPICKCECIMQTVENRSSLTCPQVRRVVFPMSKSFSVAVKQGPLFSRGQMKLYKIQKNHQRTSKNHQRTRNSVLTRLDTTRLNPT